MSYNNLLESTLCICMSYSENPTHQGAHVLPSTLVISLLLIIIVLLTIYCLRWTNLHTQSKLTLFPCFLFLSLSLLACEWAWEWVCRVRASGRGWFGNRRWAVAYGQTAAPQARQHAKTARSGHRHSFTDQLDKRHERTALPLWDGWYWFWYLLFAYLMCLTALFYRSNISPLSSLAALLSLTSPFSLL